MIGVIGCGNMASAIVKGAHNVFPEKKFLTYTPSFTRADELAKAVGGEAVKELADLSKADSIIIGCKPQQFAELAQNLAGKFDLSSKHFISIMAAIPMESIQKKLGAKKVTRVMPNTPSLFNEGVSLLLNSSDVTTKEKKLVDDIFSSVGKTHMMKDEESFDRVTTVSGSGPAYVFQFAKSMADSLVSWGVDESEARQIVDQLFVGASKLMASKEDISLDELISQVTSKGGVTIEAVKVYDKKGITEITREALDAACARSFEMTKEFGQK